jgi:DnaJ-class molecular chaperone
MGMSKSRAKKTSSNKTKVCTKCDGAGMVQSENGSKAITCSKCEGSGKPVNPFK